jgi:hypothetical protein
MKTKPARQRPTESSHQDETRPPHISTDDHSHKEPLGKGSEKPNLFRLRERRRLENDWLAPAGSEMEKRFLRRWLRHDTLSEEDRRLVLSWIRNPDEFARRDMLFRITAKKSYLGKVVYDTTIERHKNLDSKEFLVACFTAWGIKQKEIAELTHMSDKSVDNTIRSIKDKIGHEYGYDIEINELAHIARWFFGV